MGPSTSRSQNYLVVTGYTTKEKESANISEKLEIHLQHTQNPVTCSADWDSAIQS